MRRHDRATYRAMIFRAGYYRWCAARGHLLPGADPVTGQPHSIWGRTRAAERAHRKAYIALATTWLEAAREFRLESEAADRARREHDTKVRIA